jgi:multicomponent Na+:H+ antiporter subunit F
MTGFQICMLVLLAGGLGPALVLSARGRPTNRLIGLELTSAVVTVAFLLFTVISGQSYDLVLPLVLVPLSFAGSLVYTRLLSPPPEKDG